jgi:hypothetical protein
MTVQSSGGSATSATVTAKLDIADLSGGSFMGEVAGQVDCATGTFHALIENAMHTLQPYPIIPLAGTVDGTIDATTGSISGTLSYGVQDGPMCAGTWMGALQP